MTHPQGQTATDRNVLGLTEDARADALVVGKVAGAEALVVVADRRAGGIEVRGTTLSIQPTLEHPEAPLLGGVDGAERAVELVLRGGQRLRVSGRL